MGQINLFENALPKQLFRRLVHAVNSVGTERMEDMGTYNTTFWVPLGAKPSNVVEESIVRLRDLVRPGPECIGMEWWLGRLALGQSLPFHTDRDRSLRQLTGEIVHPLWSSILYLNPFPSSPTIVLDQILSPDGRSWIPPKAEFGRTLDAIPNHYVVFTGNLRHGVVARVREQSASNETDIPAASSELRLTLLVNYWHRRPMAPNCRNYDGAIYHAIQEEGEEHAEKPHRQGFAA
jgi:hypothetical protein